MLHILNKHLANERLWLMREGLGKADARYREGARMAKERIPQLEAAIKLLTGNPTGNLQHQPPAHKPVRTTPPTRQLSIEFEPQRSTFNFKLSTSK